LNSSEGTARPPNPSSPPRQEGRLDHRPQAPAGRAQRGEAERSSSGRAAAQQRDRPKADSESALPHIRLVNVGYGNLVAATRIVAIVAPGASPMRRLRREASERGKLVDVTEGRRTRSILILDSDHVLLSAINPETLAARLAQEGIADEA
jgi:regulator of extracellular matrix RemA (YlzA/DUF370 family)